MEEFEVVRESGTTGSTVVLRLKGALTLSTALPLQEKLCELSGGDTVIDVSEVRYIDSAGLGAILGHWAHMQRTGHKFALTGANPRVVTLLDITGLNAAIAIFKTAAEAEARFNDQA